MSNKEPDIFISTSENLLKKIEEQKALLGVILLIVVVAGGGWLGYHYLQTRGEAKASAEIYQYEAPIEQKKEELAKADDKEADKAKSKDKAPIDFDSQYAPLTQKLEESILKHQKTAAAKMSAVQLIGFYLEHQKFELAQSLLNKMQLSDGSLMTGLLLVQKATLLLNKQEFDTSAELFQEIVNNKNLEFLHPQALLRMGICFEKLQNIERARELYTRVSTDYPDSEASRAAKFYLRLLTLNNTSKASAG